MDIDIRPSQPDDAAAVVPRIYSSGPYSFDYVFAGDESRGCSFLRYAFQGNHGELTYQNHVSVVSDDRIVGCGAILSPKHSIANSIFPLLQVVRHFGVASSAGVIRRALAVERVIQPANGDLWIIAHLGVTPEFQGRRIGIRLIDHLVDSVRRQGGIKVGLDVALINPKAESLYKRLGFEVTATRESTLSNKFGTVPSMHRMEMAL